MNDRTMKKNFLITVSSALVLSACAGAMPELKATDIPASFEQVRTQNAGWPEQEWWKAFNSAELDYLIARAYQDNLDLVAAEARVRQADARVRQAGSSLLPFVSAGASASRSDNQPNGGPNSAADSFGANISASYELDFWGRNLNGLRSSRASRKATQADRETVALTTVAGTANTYFQLLSIRERLTIARLNLANAREVLAIAEARTTNGVATPLELARQRATIAGQEAQIPQLEQQELTTRAALAVLLGLPPENFAVTAQNLSGIRAPETAPDMTSELLVRRPDIVAAEANLQAAHADLAVARAAILPTIQLTGSDRLASGALSSLLKGPDMAFSFGLSLSQTIFDAGATLAQGDAAAARQDEVLANYRSTVLSAFSDVEVSLGNIENLSRQEKLQAEQVRQNETAFSIAQIRYREGVDDYLSLLDAQRSLYSARDASASIKLARLQASIGLFRALGGGWRDPDAPALASAQ